MRSLMFISITLFFLITPLFVNLEKWHAVYWICTSCTFCFIVSVINHNHVHQSIFYSPKLNQVLSVLLTIAKGNTSSGVIVPHNLNHHVYNNGQKDWARSSLAGDGHGIIRIFRYIFKASVSMARGRSCVQAPQLRIDDQKQLKIERLCLLVFIILIMVIDTYKSLLFVVLPWGIGTLVLISTNLMQHDGCDIGSEYNHSRNFLNRAGNWFLFNNGFHTVHHMSPGMHWSKLPEKHFEIENRIDEGLIQDSIPAFFIKQYVFNSGG